MININKSKPVMVTGATGYIAGWIIKLLLQNDITVHATVRDPNNKEKLKYLDELAKNLKGNIVYYKADLLEKHSFDEAAKKCELIFHTASPFTNTVKDPQKELIDPALQGTINVLEAVNKSDSVKRVVLTSSIAAIMGDNKDLVKLPDNMASENHWNTSSTLSHQPYSYSKTLAEKEAWKINKTQKKWQLVVINPVLVLGPGISPQISSESFKLMKQLGDGSMKIGVPNFEIGIVDVREVAQAHFNAGFMPEAEGRHIICAEPKSFLQIANLIRDDFGDKLLLPNRNLPKCLVWLAAPTVGVKRRMVARNMGYKIKIDNTKSIEKLGIKYRPVKETLIDFFSQMYENGAFNK